MYYYGPQSSYSQRVTETRRQAERKVEVRVEQAGDGTDWEAPSITATSGLRFSDSERQRESCGSLLANQRVTDTTHAPASEADRKVVGGEAQASERQRWSSRLE